MTKVHGFGHRHINTAGGPCGTSDILSAPKLEPGHYLKFLGYFPSEGETKKVRYRRYGDRTELVSNMGRGCVRSAEVNADATDIMAIRTGNLAFVSKIATGEIQIPMAKNGREDPRSRDFHSSRNDKDREIQERRCSADPEHTTKR